MLITPEMSWEYALRTTPPGMQTVPVLFHSIFGCHFESSFDCTAEIGCENRSASGREAQYPHRGQIFRVSTVHFGRFSRGKPFGTACRGVIFAKTLYPRKFVKDVSEGAGEDKRKVLDK